MGLNLQSRPEGRRYKNLQRPVRAEWVYTPRRFGIQGETPADVFFSPRWPPQHSFFDE
jgi:hypothetical protein